AERKLQRPDGLHCRCPRAELYPRGGAAWRLSVGAEWFAQHGLARPEKLRVL
ncbi:Transcriptional regulator, LysR family, partial [Pseudomonas sp. FEN]